MKKGDRIEQVMWLVEGKIVQGKNGPYWAGRFILDKEPIPAKIWQNRHLDDQARLLVPQNPYSVKATADEYNGVRQLIIHEVKPFDGEFDKSALLPKGDSQKEELAEEFDTIIEAMRDDDYKNLLKTFKNSIFFSDFSIAPAAKSIHHAWLSGLLEPSTDSREPLKPFHLFTLNSTRTFLQRVLSSTILARRKRYPRTRGSNIQLTASSSAISTWARR